ncbi:MAG TPA: glutamate synthase subunit alpha, partial [Thermomicrobiales bacterium]|nr:glutamate synthase subunit alpha [Thermomicrobiales bacterium]
VVNYFLLLAEAVRESLAAIGARSLDELVGRSDLLAPKSLPGRAGLLDGSALCAEPAAADSRRNTLSRPAAAETLDARLLEEIAPSLEAGRWVSLNATVRTSDRTIGARISHAVTMRGGNPLPPGAVTLHLTGSAGQSFGAFLVDGVRLLLEGEANDYVGKGMSGGEIAVCPPHQSPFTTPQTIAGNTILYGATGGNLFLAGAAGERFAVRNSGATAVVEGVGDHGCEYMTGGEVVVLGPTGRNFGAGMTNGVAYVYDPVGRFPDRINGESVLLEQFRPEIDASGVRGLIERHADLTGSTYARAILDNWAQERSRFWTVIPRAAVSARALQGAEEAVTTGAAD